MNKNFKSIILSLFVVCNSIIGAPRDLAYFHAEVHGGVVSEIAGAAELPNFTKTSLVIKARGFASKFGFKKPRNETLLSNIITEISRHTMSFISDARNSESRCSEIDKEFCTFIYECLKVFPSSIKSHWNRLYPSTSALLVVQELSPELKNIAICQKIILIHARNNALSPSLMKEIYSCFQVLNKSNGNIVPIKYIDYLIKPELLEEGLSEIYYFIIDLRKKLMSEESERLSLCCENLIQGISAKFTNIMEKLKEFGEFDIYHINEILGYTYLSKMESELETVTDVYKYWEKNFLSTFPDNQDLQEQIDLVCKNIRSNLMPYLMNKIDYIIWIELLTRHNLDYREKLQNMSSIMHCLMSIYKNMITSCEYALDIDDKLLTSALIISKCINGLSETTTSVRGFTDIISQIKLDVSDRCPVESMNIHSSTKRKRRRQKAKKNLAQEQKQDTVISDRDASLTRDTVPPEMREDRTLSDADDEAVAGNQSVHDKSEDEHTSSSSNEMIPYRPTTLAIQECAQDVLSSSEEMIEDLRGAQPNLSLQQHLESQYLELQDLGPPRPLGPSPLGPPGSLELLRPLGQRLEVYLEQYLERPVTSSSILEDFTVLSPRMPAIFAEPCIFVGFMAYPDDVNRLSFEMMAYLYANPDFPYDPGDVRCFYIGNGCPVYIVLGDINSMSESASALYRAMFFSYATF